MTLPDISYFILNYNPFGSNEIQPKFEQCVHALYRNSDPNINKEVIVFDQGSPDEVINKTRELQKQYKFSLYLLGRNIGISSAINLGFKMGRGKVLSLVTYDTIPTVGFDTSCLDVFKRDGNIFHVTPLSDVGDSPFQRHNTGLPFGTDDVRSKLPGSIQEVGLVELTINFFSRKCIETIGYFDERWMACYENMDYMFRTKLGGGKTVVNRAAFCWHHHNVTCKYIGRDKFYQGCYQGDPFADGRINNLWLNKWGQDINKDGQFDNYHPPSQKVIDKYKQTHSHLIKLDFPQERLYA